MKLKGSIRRGFWGLALLIAVFMGTLLFVGWHDVPAKTSAAVAFQNGWAKLAKKPPEAIQLQVAPKSQRPTLPTGCEIADVAMLMQFRGKPQTLTQIAQAIPYADNPEDGFWGNPFNDTGYTMYPPAWRSYFEKHLGSFTDLSKQSPQVFRQQLAAGKPIVCWVVMHGFSAHAILLTGFTGDTFIYNDPYTGQSQQRISTQRLWRLAASQHHRAMTY